MSIKWRDVKFKKMSYVKSWFYSLKLCKRKGFFRLDQFFAERMPFVVLLLYGVLTENLVCETPQTPFDGFGLYGHTWWTTVCSCAKKEKCLYQFWQDYGPLLFIDIKHYIMKTCVSSCTIVWVGTSLLHIIDRMV